jgi:hypothetical protein
MRLTSSVPVLSALCLAAACANNGSLPSDGSAPSVQITAPLPGADVGRLVSIDVVATDDFGVDVVICKIDGTELERKFSPPFLFVWNTNSVADSSSHTIQVDALDVAKNLGSVSITVRVVKGTH